MVGHPKVGSGWVESFHADTDDVQSDRLEPSWREELSLPSHRTWLELRLPRQSLAVNLDLKVVGRSHKTRVFVGAFRIPVNQAVVGIKDGNTGTRGDRTAIAVELGRTEGRSRCGSLGGAAGGSRDGSGGDRSDSGGKAVATGLRRSIALTRASGRRDSRALGQTGGAVGAKGGSTVGVVVDTENLAVLLKETGDRDSSHRTATIVVLDVDRTGGDGDIGRFFTSSAATEGGSIGGVPAQKLVEPVHNRRVPGPILVRFQRELSATAYDVGGNRGEQDEE